MQCLWDATGFTPKEYFLVTKEHHGQQHGRQPGEHPLVTWEGIFCQQECPWVHSYSGTKITIKGEEYAWSQRWKQRENTGALDPAVVAAVTRPCRPVKLYYNSSSEGFKIYYFDNNSTFTFFSSILFISPSVCQLCIYLPTFFTREEH